MAESQAALERLARSIEDIASLRSRLRREAEADTVKLALAIARGDSITAWAHRNGVPVSTAFRWSQDPKVRIAVQAWRRRALDRTIGRLASLAMKATEGINRLAKGADSESVQLRASRAILADMMSVSKFSVLEYRMTEIEEQVDKRNKMTRYPVRK